MFEQCSFFSLFISEGKGAGLRKKDLSVGHHFSTVLTSAIFAASE
jgi:hypothetical protein